jgi:hypothetical protein
MRLVIPLLLLALLLFLVVYGLATIAMRGG